MFSYAGFKIYSVVTCEILCKQYLVYINANSIQAALVVVY